MLKFRRSNTGSKVTDFPSMKRSPRHHHQLDRKCSFVSSQVGHSKAAILIRKISVPLAWPVEEYFGVKKDWREFTVQLALRTPDGKEYYSKPMEKVNRAFTDVDFPDEFIFPDQGPNFCIELTVYSRRTDDGGNGGGSTMVQNISRSLGRSIGQSWKRYLQQQQDQQHQRDCVSGQGPNKSFLEMLRRAGEEEDRRKTIGLPPILLDEHLSSGNDVGGGNGGQMCSLGIARFRLRNASLSGQTHNYTLEKLQPVAGVARQQMLPIYGSVCAQILLQPTSLVSPLAEGSLDIFLPEAGILHQRLHCQLRGGQMRCWEPSNLANFALKDPLLILPINENSRIEATAFPTAFRILLSSAGVDKDLENLLCISATHSALLGWRGALRLQILDCSVWSDFALAERNPHAASLGPLPGTAPPSFQPFADLEPADDDEPKKDLSPINEQGPPPLGQNGQNSDDFGHDDDRPRASSSASMLVRNARSKRQTLGLGPSKNLAENSETSPDLMKTTTGLSRTTLLDTTGQLTLTTNGPLNEPRRIGGSLNPSPAIIRRKTAQSTGDGSPSILRRLSQRPKHISWSHRDLWSGIENGVNPQNNNSAPETSNYFPTENPARIEEEKEPIEPPNGPPYVLSLHIDPNSSTVPRPSTIFPAKLPNGCPPSMSPGSAQLIKGSSVSSDHRNGSLAAKPPPPRPFNINDLARPQAARWTRAHLGRSETWHVARTSEACTRL